MRNVRLLSGLLWALNGLLGAGVVVFAFQYLLFPQDAGFLRDFDPEQSAGPRPPDRPPTRASDDVLKRLPNPLDRETGPAPAKPASSLRAQLTGVLPSSDPSRGAAFLRSTTRNVELFAFPNEPITYDGKPFDDLAGWKLVEVNRDSAVFTNGSQRQVLNLEAGTSRAGPARTAKPAAPGAALQLAGQPYQPVNYKSRLLHQDDRQQIWAIDRQEIEWMFQNQDRILDQDFQASPYPGGGIRIENVQAGSIGASRGLMPGDVVKDVNGIPLNSLADIRNLARNPTLRRQSSMRLTVERAGKIIVMMYQPLPR